MSSSCIQCQKLSKKLKVLQADYDFQLKKWQQDKASYKITSEMNFNREIKKLTQKITKLNEQKQLENQNWINKFDQHNTKHQKLLQQYKHKKDKQLQDFKIHKNNQIQHFKTNKIKHYELQIQQAQKDMKNLKLSINQAHQAEITKIQRINQQKINHILKAHEQQLKIKIKRYQGTILGLQSQKRVQQNLHKKTKQQQKVQQSNLYQQIFSLKKTLYGQQQKAINLSKQLAIKRQQLNQLNQTQIKSKAQHIQAYNLLQQNYEQKYQESKKQMQKRIQQITEQQMQNCLKYQKALQVIQEHREMEQLLYHNNIQDVRNCVEGRPSRLEDIDQILKLREQLFKKQRQMETITEELKSYKLQLANKQETFNKIFGPQSIKYKQNVLSRRNDIKKRGVNSNFSFKDIIQYSSNNTNSNNSNPNSSNSNNPNSTSQLAPLVGGIQRKLNWPPKQMNIR